MKNLIINWLASIFLLVQDEVLKRRLAHRNLHFTEEQKYKWIQAHSKFIRRERAIALLEEKIPPTPEEIYLKKGINT